MLSGRAAHTTLSGQCCSKAQVVAPHRLLSRQLVSPQMCKVTGEKKPNKKKKHASGGILSHLSLSSSFFRSFMSRWTTFRTCSASSSVRPDRSSFRPIVPCPAVLPVQGGRTRRGTGTAALGAEAGTTLGRKTTGMEELKPMPDLCVWCSVVYSFHSSQLAKTNNTFSTRRCG